MRRHPAAAVRVERARDEECDFPAPICYVPFVGHRWIPHHLHVVDTSPREVQSRGLTPFGAQTRPTFVTTWTLRRIPRSQPVSRTPTGVHSGSEPPGDHRPVRSSTDGLPRGGRRDGARASTGTRLTSSTEGPRPRRGPRGRRRASTGPPTRIDGRANRRFDTARHPAAASTGPPTLIDGRRSMTVAGARPRSAALQRGRRLSSTEGGG